MYCVVCLKNNARQFFCSVCGHNVEQILAPIQISVLEENRRVFFILPMPIQKDIIKRINKRLGSILKTGYRNDFSLNAMIKEYSEMIKLNHQNTEFGLEIPIAKNDEPFRSYKHYISPKGDL